jgi:PAS domain S-box-containing protein
MTTSRPWPLRRLLSFFALALIAPLLAFGVFAASRMIAGQRAAEEEEVRRSAQRVSAAIDRELAALVDVMQALAHSAELSTGDFAGFHRDASAAVRGTGDAILLVDRGLHQIINTRVPYGTRLPQIVDADTAGKVFATGKPAIGGLVTGPVARRPVFSVIVPVTLDGEVRYVLILSPEPTRLSRILEPQYLADGWVARISDQNGLILARSTRQRELFGKPVPADDTGESARRPGLIKASDRDGTPVLIANVWSELSGWRTAVWVPLAILEQPSRQLGQALTVVAALAFAMSLLAALWLGRMLARPIAAAATSAEALGRGDPVAYEPSAIAEVNVVGAALAAAAEQRRRTEAALKENAALAEQLTNIAAAAPGVIFSFRMGPDGRTSVPYAAPSMVDIYGVEPEEVREDASLLFERVHPEDVERVKGTVEESARAMTTWHDEWRYRHPTKGEIWIEGHSSPVAEPDGSIRWHGFVHDITARKRAEGHLRLIVKELSHRTKNLMAVVQAISWQTARKSADLKAFEERFAQRLDALSRSHDLLVERDWKGVLLADLVRAQLEPFLDRPEERLEAHGPPLLLVPQGAQDLGLAIHELATNASKYGALSVPGGKIDFGWTIDAGGGDKSVRMKWRETGGPPVIPPTRKGFGSSVITGILSRSFKGEAKLNYCPNGLSWELVAPIGHLVMEVG